MKSKYSPVLKIKEQKMSDIEIRLFNARSHKSLREAQLASIKDDLAHEEFPSSGDFGTMQLFSFTHAQRIDESELLKQKIIVANGKIIELENEYKEAYKECEKIKFLHNTEVKNMLKKIEKKNQAELDEIAVMGYFRRNKENEF